MQEISEEVILDNYCTWLISLRFLAQADSSLFNFNAIDLSTYLWIKTSILMYRVLLIIHLYKIKISTTNTWKQAHWPKISPEALRNQLRPQSPWKVTAYALHHKVQHQPIADEKRLSFFNTDVNNLQWWAIWRDATRCIKKWNIAILALNLFQGLNFTYSGVF